MRSLFVATTAMFNNQPDSELIADWMKDPQTLSVMSFHLNKNLNYSYKVFPFIAFMIGDSGFGSFIGFTNSFLEPGESDHFLYKYNESEEEYEYSDNGAIEEVTLIDKFLKTTWRWSGVSEAFLHYIHKVLGVRGTDRFASLIKDSNQNLGKRIELPSEDISLPPLSGKSFQIDLNQYSNDITSHGGSWAVFGKVLDGKIALNAVLCNQGDSPLTYSDCRPIVNSYIEYDQATDVKLTLSVEKNTQGKYPHLIITAINPVWDINKSNKFRLAFGPLAKWSFNRQMQGLKENWLEWEGRYAIPTKPIKLYIPSKFQYSGITFKWKCTPYEIKPSSQNLQVKNLCDRDGVELIRNFTPPLLENVSAEVYSNGILIGETGTELLGGAFPSTYTFQFYNGGRRCDGWGLVTCSNGGAYLWRNGQFGNGLRYLEEERVNPLVLCHKSAIQELYVSLLSSLRFVDIEGNYAEGSGGGSIEGPECNR